MYSIRTLLGTFIVTVAVIQSLMVTQIHCFIESDFAMEQPPTQMIIDEAVSWVISNSPATLILVKLKRFLICSRISSCEK
jgi:hypothetical protein